MAVRTFTFVEGELIHQYDGTNSHDILPDPLGNVVGLLGANSGIEFEFEYWPYEEVPSAFSAVTPYRYIGAQGYYSDIYSRVYVVARHYRAPYGRWMTVDPIWPGNLAYSYSACSPVTWVDPTGLEESKLCRNCPTIVDTVWGSVDSLLFRLWANDALHGGVAAKINACIQNSARALGVRCAPFGSDSLSCLKDSSFRIPIICSEGPDCDNRCAYFNGAQVVLCWNNLSNVGCHNWVDTLGGTSNNISFNIIHELLHACGYEHGSSGSGQPAPTHKQCNDIAACCIRRVAANQDTNQCRRVHR